MQVWLDGHPRYGTLLRAWRERRAIPRRAKAAAVAALGLSWSVSAVALEAQSRAAIVVFAGSLAATIGLALPWLFSRTGRDPAYGSGPWRPSFRMC